MSDFRCIVCSKKWSPFRSIKDSICRCEDELGPEYKARARMSPSNKTVVCCPDGAVMVGFEEAV